MDSYCDNSNVSSLPATKRGKWIARRDANPCEEAYAEATRL